MTLEGIHKHTGEQIVIKIGNFRHTGDEAYFKTSITAARNHHDLKHKNILRCYQYEVKKTVDEQGRETKQLISFNEPTAISLLSLIL